MSGFAEFHDELRSVARTILASATPTAHHGDPPPPVDWTILADAGWLGLEVPEAFNGAGVTFAETAIVLDELGRAAARSSSFGTAVLGVAALNAATPGAVRDDLLRAAANGATKLAVALDSDSPDPGRADPSFRVDAGRLDGATAFVPDAAGADTLLFPSIGPSGEPVLVMIEGPRAGLSVEPIEVIDGTRQLAAIRAEGVAVADTEVMTFIDPAFAVQRLFDRAAVAIACDSLGLAEAMLAATVSHVGQRSQFDRPIGSFQAVKHACADMLVQITIGRELLTAAVDAVVSGDATIEAARAKSFLGTVGVDVAGAAMQLHGGIGYSWESGVHVYLKRAGLDRLLFGRPDAHRRTLASRIIARSEPERGSVQE